MKGSRKERSEVLQHFQLEVIKAWMFLTLDFNQYEPSLEFLFYIQGYW